MLLAQRLERGAGLVGVLLHARELMFELLALDRVRVRLAFHLGERLLQPGALLVASRQLRLESVQRGSPLVVGGAAALNLLLELRSLELELRDGGFGLRDVLGDGVLLGGGGLALHPRGGHLALRRFNVRPRLVHGRTRILERLLRSLEARIALLRERLDLLLETRRGLGRGRLLLVGGGARLFGGGEIGFEFRNLLPELVRLGPLALLPDETERVLSLVQRSLELGGRLGVRGALLQLGFHLIERRLGSLERRLGGVEGVELGEDGVAVVARPAGEQAAGVEQVALDGDAVGEDVLVERDGARGGGILAHESLAKHVRHHGFNLGVAGDEGQRQLGVAVRDPLGGRALGVGARSRVNLVERDDGDPLLELTLGQQSLTGHLGVDHDLVQLTAGDNLEGGGHRRVFDLHELGDHALDARAVELGLRVLELEVEAREVAVQDVNLLLSLVEDFALGLALSLQGVEVGGRLAAAGRLERGFGVRVRHLSAGEVLREFGPLLLLRGEQFLRADELLFAVLRGESRVLSRSGGVGD